MTTVGYARVSSTGQDLGVQLEKLEATGCEKVFKEKRSGADAGRPELAVPRVPSGRRHPPGDENRPSGTLYVGPLPHHLSDV